MPQGYYETPGGLVKDERDPYWQNIANTQNAAQVAKQKLNPNFGKTYEQQRSAFPDAPTGFEYSPGLASSAEHQPDGSLRVAPPALRALAPRGWEYDPQFDRGLRQIAGFQNPDNVNNLVQRTPNGPWVQDIPVPETPLNVGGRQWNFQYGGYDPLPQTPSQASLQPNRPGAQQLPRQQMPMPTGALTGAPANIPRTTGGFNLNQFRRGATPVLNKPGMLTGQTMQQPRIGQQVPANNRQQLIANLLRSIQSSQGFENGVAPILQAILRNRSL